MRVLEQPNATDEQGSMYAISRNDVLKQTRPNDLSHILYTDTVRPIAFNGTALASLLPAGPCAFPAPPRPATYVRSWKLKVMHPAHN